MSLQPKNGDLGEEYAKNEPATSEETHFSSDPENIVRANENVLY
jgi:hypothetical protein